MNLIKSLSNINKYDVTSNCKIFCYNDRIDINGRIIFEGQISNYQKYSNELIVEYNERTVYYNLTTEDKIEIDYIGEFLTNNILLVGRWNEEYTKRLISAIDLIDNKTLWTSNRSFFKNLIYKDKFISFGDREITLNEIKSAQPLWQHSLLSYGTYLLEGKEEFAYEMSKFLGIWKNELIVACSNGLILSINVEIGETLYKWQELKGFEIGTIYKGVLPDASSFVLDETQAKLIGVFHTYYFEIDLVSREITYIQLEEELSNHSIRNFKGVSDNPFTSTHLYLTADITLDELPNTELNAVLALNRDTKKVDWVHTFKESGIGTNIPQINDTHLYILDLKGTLHVFEK